MTIGVWVPSWTTQYCMVDKNKLETEMGRKEEVRRLGMSSMLITYATEKVN